MAVPGVKFWLGAPYLFRLLHHGASFSTRFRKSGKWCPIAILLADDEDWYAIYPFLPSASSIHTQLFTTASLKHIFESTFFRVHFGDSFRPPSGALVKCFVGENGPSWQSRDLPHQVTNGERGKSTMWFSLFSNMFRTRRGSLNFSGFRYAMCMYVHSVMSDIHPINNRAEDTIWFEMPKL